MARILVADADDVSRHQLGRALQAAGHEIRYAPTAEDALERATDPDVRLIVADARLTLAGGTSLISELRYREAGVKIIALSAGGSPVVGALTTLTRPVPAEELTTTVDHVIGRGSTGLYI